MAAAMLSACALGVDAPPERSGAGNQAGSPAAHGGGASGRGTATGDAAVEPDALVLPTLGGRAGRALFVAANTRLGAADAKLAHALQGMGFSVEVRRAARTRPIDAADKRLVLISASATLAALGPSFRDVPVPLLTWQSGLYPGLGLTGAAASGGAGVSLQETELEPILLGHPLAASERATFVAAISSSDFSFGVPAPSALPIASLAGDPSRLAVFAYEAQAQMFGVVAPARRVGLFLSEETASVLSESGWAIFRAAVRWASEDRSAAPDADHDGLPDQVETRTGVFVDATDTGTDPHDPDSDADGLQDGDEVTGTQDGLDLPALGCSPLRKDILLEYDWFDDATGCPLHTHRPSPAALELVDRAFQAAPIDNPDGTQGIHVIHDYGQAVPFDGGNWINDVDGSIVGGVADDDFAAHKRANLSPLRRNYFHYVLLSHTFVKNGPDGKRIDAAGNATIFGSDMLLGLQCVSDDFSTAWTIMHELGHNLGLDHGGDEPTNYKPSYNSIMNYGYKKGIDQNCDGSGDRVLSFSRGERREIDERSVIESAGLCSDEPLDWNGDGQIAAGSFALDLNGDGKLQVLRDFDDWGNLVLKSETWVSSAAAVAVCELAGAR